MNRAAYFRQYYLANRERLLQQRRDWYAANREATLVKHREYERQNRYPIKVGRELGIPLAKARELINQ